ncbi:hypothetical protein AB0I77_50390 [Streptomyces sp. NPDC050619]|uniref:hypothetical protein n=1 Tax=Streptomyces sp. NPDC050619 TaxID=3157214 RepID=UPI00342F9B1F
MEHPPDQQLDPLQRPILELVVPAVREGPRFNSRSSRSHCPGLSRSTEAGLFERRVSAPPSSHTRRRRRTDRDVTRSPLATASVFSPRANPSAA